MTFLLRDLYQCFSIATLLCSYINSKNTMQSQWNVSCAIAITRNQYLCVVIVRSSFSFQSLALPPRIPIEWKYQFHAFVFVGKIHSVFEKLKYELYWNVNTQCVINSSYKWIHTQIHISIYFISSIRIKIYVYIRVKCAKEEKTNKRHFTVAKPT